MIKIEKIRLLRRCETGNIAEREREGGRERERERER